MRNYVPLSVKKIIGISKILSGIVTLVMTIYFIQLFKESSTGVAKLLVVSAVLGFCMGMVMYIVIRDYFILKFKTNIHLEINQEFQRIYDKYLIECYGDKDYIENLREKASPEFFEKEYVQLTQERDLLLRKY